MTGIPASTIRHALIYSAALGVGTWIGRGGLHHPIWPLAFVVVVLYTPVALWTYSVGYRRGQHDLRCHIKTAFDRIPSSRDRRS